MRINGSTTVDGERSRHGSTTSATTGQEYVHREECCGWSSEAGDATNGGETTAAVLTHRRSDCFFYRSFQLHRRESIDLLRCRYLLRLVACGCYHKWQVLGTELQECGRLRLPAHASVRTSEAK